MKYSFELKHSTLTAIEKSTILILDTSIWIRLSDGKTQEAIRIRKLLLKLKEDEKIICPLTLPTVFELIKQKGESLQRTAILMECLSSNISFRSLEQLFDLEVFYFFKYLQSGILSEVSLSEKFGTLLCFLPNLFDNETSLTCIQREYLFRYSQQISLTNLIHIFDKDFLHKNNDTPSPYQASNVSRRKMTRGDIKKSRRVEQEYIARSIIIPQLNELRGMLPIDEQLQIIRKINNLHKSKKYGSVVEHALTFMPILSAFIEVMTLSGLDINRKDSENDMYDRELITYGLSHPYIFAAIDKGIASLFKNCDDGAGKIFISSLNGLESYLEKI